MRNAPDEVTGTRVSGGIVLIELNGANSIAPSSMSRCMIRAIASEAKPVADAMSSCKVFPSIQESTNASSGPIGKERTSKPLTKRGVLPKVFSGTAWSSRGVIGSDTVKAKLEARNHKFEVRSIARNQSKDRQEIISRFASPKPYRKNSVTMTILRAISLLFSGATMIQCRVVQCEIAGGGETPILSTAMFLEHALEFACQRQRYRHEQFPNRS